MSCVRNILLLSQTTNKQQSTTTDHFHFKYFGTTVVLDWQS
jgi:hypothetical protein